MPAGLTVYEPRVTFDGTTTTLTYNVKADFSDWTDTDSGIKYMAQKAAVAATDAEPQSIEALIWHYGAVDSGLFSTAVTTVTAETEYELKANTTKYLIIPLDTSLIKEYLLQKYTVATATADNGKFPDLVWIEENPAIDKIDPLDGTAANNWKDGTYQATGFRISGLAKPDANVVIAGTIENFDDGGKIDPEQKAARIPSIATVLADGDNQKVRYTSTINFYAGALADSIHKNLTATDTTKWANADAAKLWMKERDNKPALRILYQWMD
ncbi:MAG: hypothetical protein LBL31_00560 [Spirochaetaceae bacterium]|jgi:hypothetical protein|nr:hypothetical protein [Spirochaetaceae bacterium]